MDDKVALSNTADSKVTHQISIQKVEFSPLSLVEGIAAAAVHYGE